MNALEAGLLGELFDPTPTWDLVCERALHDPVLQQLVTMDRLGYADRETLLMTVVLWLSKERQRLIDAEIERRKWGY